MEQHPYIKSIGEVFPHTVSGNDVRSSIECIIIDSKYIKDHLTTAVFLNAATAILILSGSADIRINYKSYTAGVGSVILLSAAHSFYFNLCSNDLRCRCLLVSQNFMQEMDSTEMIYRRIKYGVRLYNSPVVHPDPDSTARLSKRLQAIDEAIDDTQHLYHKELILNTLFAFYLDMSHIIDSRQPSEESNMTRYESIIQSFIGLLAANYRREHKVEFYASQLHISAHYLTLIVKRLTGQSVSNFIFEMLHSDARTLLSDSKLSIQEIAAKLHFADQSSFGKFFHRKAGISPADYRRFH